MNPVILTANNARLPARWRERRGASAPAQLFRLGNLDLLAQHHGFTAAELDFILNCDIKPRLGRDAGNTED